MNILVFILAGVILALLGLVGFLLWVMSQNVGWYK
jgi:hypothetical protein